MVLVMGWAASDGEWREVDEEKRAVMVYAVPTWFARLES